MRNRNASNNNSNSNSSDDEFIKPADSLCYDMDCRFFGREHKHVITSNGEYVKYIIHK